MTYRENVNRIVGVQWASVQLKFNVFISIGSFRIWVIDDAEDEPIESPDVFTSGYLVGRTSGERIDLRNVAHGPLSSFGISTDPVACTRTLVGYTTLSGANPNPTPTQGYGIADASGSWEARSRCETSVSVQGVSCGEDFNAPPFAESFIDGELVDIEPFE